MVSWSPLWLDHFFTVDLLITGFEREVLNTFFFIIIITLFWEVSFRLSTLLKVLVMKKVMKKSNLIF